MRKRKSAKKAADDVVTISGIVWNHNTRIVGSAVNYNAQVLKDAMNRIAELEKHIKPQAESGDKE
jgi:DNA polymerase III delta subunit